MSERRGRGETVGIENSRGVAGKEEGKGRVSEWHRRYERVRDMILTKRNIPTGVETGARAEAGQDDEIRERCNETLLTISCAEILGTPTSAKSSSLRV